MEAKRDVYVSLLDNISGQHYAGLRSAHGEGMEVGAELLEPNPSQWLSLFWHSDPWLIRLFQLNKSSKTSWEHPKLQVLSINKDKVLSRLFSLTDLLRLLDFYCLWPWKSALRQKLANVARSTIKHYLTSKDKNPGAASPITPFRNLSLRWLTVWCIWLFTTVMTPKTSTGSVFYHHGFRMSRDQHPIALFPLRAPLSRVSSQKKRKLAV